MELTQPQIADVVNFFYRTHEALFLASESAGENYCHSVDFFSWRDDVITVNQFCANVALEAFLSNRPR